MWILFALGSAFFAGLTSVVAKCGIKKTDSTVATAIRTGVVLICSAVMVTIVGSWGRDNERRYEKSDISRLIGDCYGRVMAVLL